MQNVRLMRWGVPLVAALFMTYVAGMFSLIGANSHPLRPWATPTGFTPAGTGMINAVQQGNHYQLEYHNKWGQVTWPIVDFWVEENKCKPHLAPGFNNRSAELWWEPVGNGSCKIVGNNIIADYGADVGDIHVYPTGFYRNSPEVYIRINRTSTTDSFRIGN